MYKKNKQIHFVGIGGIGMSGIAELLLPLGCKVSGSDLRSTETTRRLQQLGAVIYQGHQADNITGADVVVISSAVGTDNPEVLAAQEQQIPVIQRAEMLAELMRLKRYGIAIAGSHGKTSTSSLIASLLHEAGLEPTVAVGGKVDCFGGSNALLGNGEFMVAEADESDGSFLKLSPVIEVITNIDLEHVDYYRDLDHIKETFLEFISRIPFYGAAVLCLDDANVASLLPQIQRRKITYGLTEQADLHAAKIELKNFGSEFSVYFQGEELGRVRRNSPGRHVILNSLAAIAVALELEIDFPVIAHALEKFEGVQRRLQIKGEQHGILVVDDYGHHPTEIRATLDAVREGWPERRLLVAFQPHRYSRTQGLFNEFTTAFYRSDVLILTDIYAASEEPIEGVSSSALLEAIRQHGHRHALYHPDLETLPAALLDLVEDGDLVLTLGAGNIVQVGEQLLQLLEQKTTAMKEQQRKRLADSGLATKFDVDMAAYCTLRAGGRAAALIEVTNPEELGRLLVLLAEEKIKFFVIGRGSNLLVADSGWSGAVIRLKGDFNTIEVQARDSEAAIVKAGTGCSLSKLVSWCSKQGLAGLEFLVGIPGSVGGAVRMNAGAWGQEIGTHLLELELIDKQGNIQQIPATELHLSYRSLGLVEGNLAEMIITSALFRLRPEQEETVRARCSDHLKKRKGKQPAGVASAGSFFKNPPNHFAGRLIEAAGLKGLRCGGAMVSPVHANFIVNSGGASATDIVTLMEQVQTEVATRFGICLEPEVQIIQEDCATAWP